MNTLLKVQHLKIEFINKIGNNNIAVHDACFDIQRNSITAIVGESGSGKSATANSIMRLLPSDTIITGSIEFSPKAEKSYDILSLNEQSEQIYKLRGQDISMVFQEPMSALSPVHTIGDQITEAILCHHNIPKKQAWFEATEMLEKVGIDDADRRMNMYAFEFSGGMRQRVVIAMALVCKPQLLICDEPTTALDVTIQAEILNLIRSSQQTLNNSVLVITHDIGVVAQLADNVIVMYQGRVVETGTVRQVLKKPLHPYTKALLAATPGVIKQDKLMTISKDPIAENQNYFFPLITLKDGRKISAPLNEKTNLNLQIEARGEVNG